VISAGSAIRGLLALFLCVCSASCVLPPHSPPAGSHVVVHKAKPPPGRTQKWNPAWWLGNADDSTPPDWYRPGERGRNALWQLRNPLHNFTFYVIGTADKDFVRYGSEPTTVFSKDGGWNWAISRRGWLHLPFVSYRGKHVQFYALWRERGNFGLKLNRPRPKRKPVSASAPHAAVQRLSFDKVALAGKL
jgi:hypothetical protein